MADQPEVLIRLEEKTTPPERRDKTKHKGFAVWLRLDRESDKALNTFFYATRVYFGFVSETPHITLISSIMHDEEDTIRRTERLVEMLKPIPIKFRGVVYGVERNSLHVSVEPTRAIMNARKLACEIFDNYKLTPYLFPHLTIGHGNISNTEREELWGMHDVAMERIDNKGLTKRIKMDRLDIYRPGAADKYGDWKPVREFEIRKPPQKSKILA